MHTPCTHVHVAALAEDDTCTVIAGVLREEWEACSPRKYLTMHATEISR